MNHHHRLMEAAARVHGVNDDNFDCCLWLRILRHTCTILATDYSDEAKAFMGPPCWDSEGRRGTIVCRSYVCGTKDEGTGSWLLEHLRCGVWNVIKQHYWWLFDDVLVVETVENVMNITTCFGHSNILPPPFCRKTGRIMQWPLR